MLGRTKFDAVLATLTEHHRKGDCFILFTSPYAGTIELRDRQAIDALQQDGLSEDEIRAGIQEITSMVLAALRGSGLDEIFYVMRGAHSPPAEERAEYESRFAAVQAALVDAHLTRRYQIKRLSKAPAFSDIEWDVKIKISDALEQDFDPFPYATLKLKYQSGFDDLGFRYFGGNGESQSVQVNFTTDELDYLINVLRRARESLGLAESYRMEGWQGHG